MVETTIESLLEEKRVFSPPPEFSKKAYIKSLDEYRKIYESSIKDPASFWAEKADQLSRMPGTSCGMMNGNSGPRTPTCLGLG